MPKVTFLPANITVEAKKFDKLLDVALEHNISIQHACGGFCACTTCHCEIIQGDQNIDSPKDDEKERLEYLDGKTPHSRLACQSKIMGDITVRVVNQD